MALLQDLRRQLTGHPSDLRVQIVGYSAAALGAFFFVEWLIHLPGLNLVGGGSLRCPCYSGASPEYPTLAYCLTRFA